MAKHKSFTYTGTAEDNAALEDLLDSDFKVVSCQAFEYGIHYILLNKFRHH